MQNHAKRRFNNSNVNVMAAIAIGAMLVFSVAGTKAFADNVVNDVDASTNSETITAGDEDGTTVSYKLVATSSPRGDVSGCNADATTPVSVAISTPEGVTADPGTLSFTECGVSQSVKFTADADAAIDTTLITVDATGGRTGSLFNETPAEFNLAVEEPAGGGGGGDPTPTTDTTAPVIKLTVTPDTPDGAIGWYKSNVQIDWTVTDPESSVTIDSGCEDQTITADTDSSGVTLNCEAHNSAGLSSSDSVNIKKDGTEPTVSLVVGDNVIAAGGSYFFGFVPSGPTCEASDPTPGSGLDGECTVAGYGDSVGEHTVKATANDKAGNTGESESITYTVKKWDLTGFYQPVDMGSTINTVKGGSTVPFKFDISAATEFTSTTFNGNPIGTFSAKKVSCTAGSEDAIEQVVTATGGTALRYDTTSGQFVYNWQTPKGAGICYDTTFTDQSGGILTAHFKTK